MIYFLALPTREQGTELHFIPQENGILQSDIIFQQSEDHDILNEKYLKLGQESYKLEIVFNSVAETHHNMESGNIYVSAKMKSLMPG